MIIQQRNIEINFQNIINEEKDDSVIEYEEYQDIALQKPHRPKQEMITLAFYTGGNEIESRNDFSYSHSMDENPNKSSGQDENQRSTTEEDITMFSRPIYYFNQGERQTSEGKDQVNPESEYSYFKTMSPEAQIDTHSSNFKATSADSKEKDTEEYKKISDSRQIYPHIFEMTKDEGFSFKNIQKQEETPKTTTFGFKPVRRNSSKSNSSHNNNDFMNTVSRAIDFFSKKLEVNSPSKNKQREISMSTELSKTKKLYYTRDAHRNVTSPKQEENASEESMKRNTYLNFEGESSKFIGMDYKIKPDLAKTRLLLPVKPDKSFQRVKTEDSHNTLNIPNEHGMNSPKFPMSDTFFAKEKEVAIDVDSVKALAPNTISNPSSDNYMIEDSMNIDLDEPKEMMYHEHSKPRNYKAHNENQTAMSTMRLQLMKANHELQEAQIKIKELQLCCSYFQEMYEKEREDK